MTPADRADAYMRKAERALSAARLLLGDGDTEGACNRAYYAMFYAAHVLVFRAGDESASNFRTHAGLIAAFGKYAVVDLKMDPELGRAINQVQRLRQVADYTGDAPLLDEAQFAVGRAERFLAAIRSAFE